jgi:hypothetical protein
MECEPAQSHCTQPAGSVSRVRSAGGEIQTVGCEARYALYLLFLQEQIKDIIIADVQSARSRVVCSCWCGCEMIENMERSGGEIWTVGSHKWNP